MLSFDRALEILSERELGSAEQIVSPELKESCKTCAQWF